MLLVKIFILNGSQKTSENSVEILWKWSIKIATEYNNGIPRNYDNFLPVKQRVFMVPSKKTSGYRQKETHNVQYSAVVNLFLVGA